MTVPFHPTSALTRRRLLGRAAGIAALAGVAAAVAVPPPARARQATPEPAGTDPLPSWNDGPAKREIVDFVLATVTPGSGAYRPPAERIAAFDHDGTLMGEYPGGAYSSYVLDRARDLAATVPEYAETPQFAPLLAGAFDDLAAIADPDPFWAMQTLVNGGLTQQMAAASARGWLETAVNPRVGKRFVDLAYQPMLEVLDLFAANGFTNFIVTGTEADFCRVFAPAVFGIDPWRVIGTEYAYGYAVVDGRGQVLETSQDIVVRSGVGKATAIAMHIGLRPITAFGNSDGDLEMLQYAAGGAMPSLRMLIHHTDAAREFAYDRDYAFSRLDQALAVAAAQDITVVDMARDWATIYAAEPAPSLLAGA